MRIRNLAAAIALEAATIALSACATSLNTRVTRYQAMPAPQGQTFFVVAEGPMAGQGGLEFQRYAALVTQQLQARGYAPAADAGSASMVVRLDYNIDKGQVRVVQDPFGPYGYGFGANPFFYPRFGFRSAFYYGWNDPFWYGGGADSYVEYHSELGLHIRAHGTDQPLFDGRAQARSETNRLDVVLPSLIEAMFTGFPGQNGETVKITIPAKTASR